MKIWTIALIVIVTGACSNDVSMMDEPNVALVRPEAICRVDGGHHMYIEVAGEGFAPTFLDDPEGSLDLAFEQVDGSLEVEPRLGEFFTASPTRLVVRFPVSGFLASTAPPMIFDVRVTNPDGQKDVLPTGLTLYSDVRLSNITPATPASGTAGSTVNLTLTGSGFYDYLLVRLGDELVSTFATVESPTTATVELDLHDDLAPGMYSITIENLGGCSDTVDLAFEVLAPAE